MDEKLDETWRFPMPLMCASFEPGKLDDAVAAMSDDDYRVIARAEAAYFRGQPEQACELATPYLSSDDISLRISACFICGYANLSLNHAAESRRCQAILAAVGEEPIVAADSRARAAYQLFYASSCVLLHLPAPVTREEFAAVAAQLPEGLRLFAGYALAHSSYLAGDYGQCVGMAENALIMRQGSYPISELFLHLVAAMGWMSQREPEHARSHFMAAWDIARPDDLIELIGEHHGLLQGVLELCLKKDYPRDYARIIDITYRFSYGWRRVHNPDTGESVADDLTTTEFTIAMLACRGWSNDEIASYLGVSRGTVKNRLSSVYVKLGISSRAELKQFMLR